MPFFQLLPILALSLYVLYSSYYYAVPMFCLKILIFIAYGIHRCTDIRFYDAKITVKIPISGEERVIERPVDVDLASRHLAATVLREFRAVMKEIRKLKRAAKKDSAL